MRRKYMIHACLAREWYVNDYLVPSMTAQGIPEEDIVVWVDRDGRGNLSSCIETFYQCSRQEGETWHLQDDVIISREFAERSRNAPDGVVCGFCVQRYEGQDPLITGETTAWYMWQSSFPCIKIPNEIAGEFVDWFIDDAQHREDLKKYVETGKKDDTLFHVFMLENHFKMNVFNMKPHIVDHVDYLIGGSIINQLRDHIARSCLWDEDELIEELRIKLANR